MKKPKPLLIAVITAAAIVIAPTPYAIPERPIAPGPSPPINLFQATRATASNETWASPVPLPLTIGRKFDPPDVRWHAGHRGVDVCPGVGTPVRAPRAGTIIYAGRLADRNLVSIRHSNGLRTTFEPVTPRVRVNDTVSQGTVVGVVEGGHDGDCLHWGVKVSRDRYLNPILLLYGEPILKPWDEPAA